MATQLLEYTGNQFVAELSNVVVYICLAAAILSIVYAVYIAYLFFTASDQNKRKAAKDRLIKTIASCLIIFTAAAILKGLDITFNKNGLSGSFSGPETPTAVGVYFYDGAPELNLSKPAYSSVITGEFTLYADKIKDLDSGKTFAEVNGAKVFFQECSVIKPTIGWLESVDLNKFVISSDKKTATYTYSIESSLVAGGEFGGIAYALDNPDDYYYDPTKSNYENSQLMNKYIHVKVSFSCNGGLYFLNIKVKLTGTDDVCFTWEEKK